jgi:hypothetical protein
MKPRAGTASCLAADESAAQTDEAKAATTMAEQENREAHGHSDRVVAFFIALLLSV